MARKASPTIAIDLGTANTRAGILHGDKYKIFREDNSHSDAIPSYVAFTHSGVLVGESALNQLSENPSNTVYDITRLLGRHYPDPAIQNCMKQWPSKVVQGAGEKAMVLVHYNGKEWQLTPEEICSILLKRLKQIAENSLKCKVTSTVIAIPVYFNYNQRVAVKHAGYIAGFNFIKLIGAPVAASMFHSLTIQPPYHFGIYPVEYKLVMFDLGAGTLDVSVVAVKEGICKVLATAGDIHDLCGNDIDNKLVDHFVNAIKVKRDRDISTNTIAVSRLRGALERAKISLSESETTDVEIPQLCEGINFKAVVTKAWFEQLGKETCLNCIDIMVKCLKEAGISSIDMVNNVILLGGSTRIPLLRQLIKDYFEGNKNVQFEPEELAVICGTSVLASQLNSAKKEKGPYMELIDAIPFSLSIKSIQGDIEALIVSKNTQIPKTVHKQIYYRHYNEQNTLFQVCEVKGKYSPGHILLSNLQLYGKKAPVFKIECMYNVWFEIEMDGVLNVTIEDTSCRIHKNVRISSSLVDVLPIVKESKMRLLQLDVLESTEEHNTNMEIVVESNNRIAEKKEIVEQKELAIGIDMGTTNCCAGVWRRNRVEIIATEYGNRATLSSVSFTEKERLIGDATKQQMIMNPSNSIINVKRLMGRRNLDVKTLPFKVNAIANGRLEIVVQYKGEEKLFAPEEITAMMLRKIKEQADEHTKTEIKNVVITVPSCFNQSQRKATRHAGRIAGLNVMQLLNEPTAAAITYYLHKSSLESFDKKSILVFDLGGGTFDVSVMTIIKGKIQVIAVLGDGNLGGEDFDTNMVNHFVEKFNSKKEMKGKNVRDNPKSLRRLRVACEKAKRVLSTVPKTKIDLDALYEGIDLSTAVTKEKFEALNKGLIKRLLEIMERCLQNARMDRSEIDDVVLVGGSTRIPLLQQDLQSFFKGKELYKSINQDEAVAYGAAIQAAKLSGSYSEKFQSFEIHDVTSLSLGIKITGGAMHLLAPRYSKLPFELKQIYTTCKNNQSEIPISLYECELFGDNSDEALMGKFVVSGIPPQPKGSSKVCVNLNIDSSGILNLSAIPYDMEDSESKAIFIKEVESPNLTEKEIEGMMSSAEKFKADDLEQKNQAEELNALENFALGMIKIANDPNVGAMKKSQIEGAVTETLNWLEEHHNAKIEEIGKKKQELESLCHQENDENMQELESL